MALKFDKLPTGDANLDRVQQRIADLASKIPDASGALIVSVASDYRVTGNEDVIHCDAQAGPIRITLRAPSSSNRPLTIKQVNPPSGQNKVNPVTVVTGDGSKTIAGASAYALDSTGTGSVSITSDDSQHWPNTGGSASAASTTITKYVAGDGIQIAGNVISSTVTGGSGTNISGLLPPLNPVAVYQAPWGSDGNPGTSWWKAVLTSSAALAILQAAGGGELHVMDGSTVQIWLRGDGVSIPGWFTDFPLTVYGYGTSHWSFGFPAAKLRGGSQTDRLTPQIWLAGTFQPKAFYDIAPFDFINQFIREWDYRRNVDGTIQYCNVTSWVRSGTSATVTLALPTPYNVDSVTRGAGSNIVTLTYTLPRRNMGRMRGGQVIRVASTDPHFDSGDFVVLSTPLAGTTIQLTYAQTTSAGGPFTGAAGVTVQSSDIGVSDRIEFTTTQPLNVPTTAFRVTAIGNGGTPNAAVITVSDVYGGQTVSDPLGNNPIGTFPASGTFTSPGTWVIQDRYNYRTSTIDWYNIQGSGRGSPPYDSGLPGPNIDIGGMDDGRQRFFKSAPGIFLPVHGCPDPDRVAFALLDPGSNGSSGGDWYNCRPAGVGLRRYGSRDTTDSMRIVDMLANNGYGTAFAPPCVEIINGGAISLTIDGVFVADRQALDLTPDVRIDACTPQSQVINCTTVQGSVCIAGNAGSLTQSAWTRGQTGAWPSGNKATYAGDMPHQRRLLPLAMARFANLAPAPASWTNVTTLTTGVADNWGRTGAVRVQASTDAYILPTLVISIASGEWVVFGGWVRKAAGFASSVLNVRLYFAAGGTVDYFLVPFKGDGEWQPVSGKLQATAAVSAVDFSIAPGASSGAGVELSDVFFEHATSVSTNEAAEYAGTIGNRSRTLAPGTAGTLEGMPFVASGGIGVDSSVIVSPSGTAAQAGNLPILGADGVTPIAWVPTVGSNKALAASAGVTSVGATAPVTSTGGATPTIALSIDGTLAVSAGNLGRAALTGDATASAGSNAVSVPSKGKVMVDSGDAVLDYLSNKVESTSGNISVTDVSGGGGKMLNLNVATWAPFASLSYEWSIGSTPFPSPAGYLSTSSETNYTAGVLGYETGVAAVSVRLSVNVNTNSLTGGLGDWDITLYRNGSATAATFNFVSGVTGKNSISVAVAGGAATDDYALYWQANGVGTGGTVGFTACILVSGTA